MSHAEDAQSFKMFEQGLGLIEEGKIDEALQVARILEERCFTGCFDLDYRAHLARGEEVEGLQALERGTQVAPDAWYLWKLIGIHHSDREAWDEARTAFGKALANQWVDPSDIHCNLAVLESRAQRPAEARAHIAQISEPNAFAFARTIEIDLLQQEERFDEALAAARAWLEGYPDGDLGLRAEVFAKIADVLRLSGSDDVAVEAELNHAIELDNANPKAARIIREIGHETSAAAKMWRLLVQGIIRTPMPATDEGRQPFGFVTAWFVVADDIDQAMGFIRRFEPAERHESLKVADAEEIQPAPEALLGVYERRGGYSCFPLDNSGE